MRSALVMVHVTVERHLPDWRPMWVRQVPGNLHTFFHFLLLTTLWSQGYYHPFLFYRWGNCSSEKWSKWVVVSAEPGFKFIRLSKPCSLGCIRPPGLSAWENWIWRRNESCRKNIVRQARTGQSSITERRNFPEGSDCSENKCKFCSQEVC